MNLEDLVFDVNGRVFTDDGATVVELTNPITRDRVRLDPPYEVAEGELERLDAVFNDYCLLAWENGSDNPANKYRVSPAVVDPYRLLEGSMPLPDLHQQLRDLVAGFGFWAVDGALGRLRPEATP